MNRKSEYYQLEREQEEIYDLLRERDLELAEFYKGGVIALSLDKNPESLVHAAHSFREVLEKLPKIVDVPFDVTKQQQRFRSNIKKNLSDWGKFKKEDNNEEEECEKAVNILEELNKMHGKINTRRDEFRTFIENHEDRQRMVHDDILDRFYKQKKDLYGFFAGISHHSKTCDQDEFFEKVSNLEFFLTAVFEPPTSTQIDEIDDLLGI